MSNFPLYDSLCHDLPTEELTAKEKDEFMKLIKKVDQLGYELIYALIRVYQFENTDERNSCTLPFGGKYIENNDITFHLDDIPLALRHILLKFLRLHINTMKEKKTIPDIEK